MKCIECGKNLDETEEFSEDWQCHKRCFYASIDEACRDLAEEQSQDPKLIREAIQWCDENSMDLNSYIGRLVEFARREVEYME